MKVSVHNNLRIWLGLAWLVDTGIGAYRTASAVLNEHRAINQTLKLIDTLAKESREIVVSADQIRALSRESQFLQSLVTVLPQSKSFVRTQRAMEDEVETLRY